jgi:hypothetical protein
LDLPRYSLGKNGVSFKWLFPIEKVAIGMVGLVDFGYQLFANPHHFGIKVPNPVHLDGFVGKGGLATHLVVAQDNGALHPFALMLWHHTKDQPEHFIGWKKGFVPEKFEFPYQV